MGLSSKYNVIPLLFIHAFFPFPEDLYRFTDGTAAIIEQLLDLVQACLVFIRPVIDIDRCVEIVFRIGARLHFPFYHATWFKVVNKYACRKLSA